MLRREQWIGRRIRVLAMLTDLSVTKGTYRSKKNECQEAKQKIAWGTGQLIY